MYHTTLFLCPLMFYQVQAETEADKLQTDYSQDGEISQSQTSASSTSAFQLIANAFRRTFSVTNPSSNAAVPMFVSKISFYENLFNILQARFFSLRAAQTDSWILGYFLHRLCTDLKVFCVIWWILLLLIRRPKREGNRKQRPMSLGAIGLTSLFSSTAPEASRDENKTDAQWAAVGSNPWESGQDLPSLLQSVSLRGRRDSGGVFSEDMASLPGKRVNLFSSLRLKKSKTAENEGQDQEMQKEIMTILTNLSNKGRFCWIIYKCPENCL